MEIQKEFNHLNNDNNVDSTFKFKNNEILNYEKMKDILSKLFDNRKEYRDIIKPKLLMEKFKNIKCDIHIIDYNDKRKKYLYTISNKKLTKNKI
jgi:hypothetical protein